MSRTERAKGSVYFISNQLPEPYAEQRRQMEQLAKDSREQPISHQMNMKWSKNKQLIVNNNMYKKLITSQKTKIFLGWMQEQQIPGCDP